jgi:hypothetical protein
MKPRFALRFAFLTKVSGTCLKFGVYYTVFKTAELDLIMRIDSGLQGQRL